MTPFDILPTIKRALADPDLDPPSRLAAMMIQRELYHATIGWQNLKEKAYTRDGSVADPAMVGIIEGLRGPLQEEIEKLTVSTESRFSKYYVKEEGHVEDESGVPGSILQ